MNVTARSNGVLITKKPFKVLVCLVTLVAFLFNTVYFDVAWAVGTPSALTGRGTDRAGGPGLFKELHPDTFTLPEYLGHIKDSYGDKNSDKVIIHIQDAHCNYGAQRKIAEIIQYLNKEYGISAINLEGGVKDYDLSVFTNIYDKNIREKTADYFVKEGFVNGAEYFAINNPEKAILWGIEDTKLYLDNLNVYRDSLKYKDEVDRHLNALTHILANLKTKIYSPWLLELDNKYSQYKVGTLEFKDYLAYLIQVAKQKAIDIKAFTNIYLLSQTLGEEDKIDFKKANNQRDDLIGKLQKKLSKKSLEELVLKTVEFRSEKISQKDFYAYLTKKANLVGIELNDLPDLQKYIVYISMYNAIDKMKIMDEIDKLETAIKDSLYQNDKQKELNKLSKNLAILKNIFNVSLTKEDYKYYVDNEQSFDAVHYASFITKEAPLHKVAAELDRNISDLDRYRSAISKFYEYSFKRDDVFLKNIKFGSKQKIAIVVTGGFHTENLCETFKKQGIAYISIMPAFNNHDSYQCPYFSLLAGKENGLMRQLYPIVASKSSIQIASMLSTAIAPEVWGKANIDVFDAAVFIQSQIERGRKVEITVTLADGSSRVILFGEGDRVVKMSLNRLLKRVHQRNIDLPIRQAYQQGKFKAVSVEAKAKAAQRIRNIANALSEENAEKLNRIANQIENGEIAINFVDVGNAEFEAHAGGQGIHINNKLENDLQTTIDLIVHEAIAGITGDHLVAEAAQEGRLNDVRDLLGTAKLDVPIWKMTAGQRREAQRDFANIPSNIVANHIERLNEIAKAINEWADEVRNENENEIVTGNIYAIHSNCTKELNELLEETRRAGDRAAIVLIEEKIKALSGVADNALFEWLEQKKNRFTKGNLSAIDMCEVFDAIQDDYLGTPYESARTRTLAMNIRNLILSSIFGKLLQDIHANIGTGQFDAVKNDLYYMTKMANKFFSETVKTPHDAIKLTGLFMEQTERIPYINEKMEKGIMAFQVAIDEALTKYLMTSGYSYTKCMQLLDKTTRASWYRRYANIAIGLNSEAINSRRQAVRFLWAIDGISHYHHGRDLDEEIRHQNIDEEQFWAVADSIRYDEETNSIKLPYYKTREGWQLLENGFPLAGFSFREVNIGGTNIILPDNVSPKENSIEKLLANLFMHSDNAEGKNKIVGDGYCSSFVLAFYPEEYLKHPSLRYDAERETTLYHECSHLEFNAAVGSFALGKFDISFTAINQLDETLAWYIGIVEGQKRQISESDWDSMGFSHSAYYADRTLLPGVREEVREQYRERFRGLGASILSTIEHLHAIGIKPADIQRLVYNYVNEAVGLALLSGHAKDANFWTEIAESFIIRFADINKNDAETQLTHISSDAKDVDDAIEKAKTAFVTTLFAIPEGLEAVAIDATTAPVVAVQTPSQAAKIRERYMSNEEAGNYVFLHLPPRLFALNQQERQKNVLSMLKNRQSGIYRKGNVIFIPITGLMANTGQFGHIGLWQAYGMPVVYIDADYINNDTVEGHELTEIRNWQEALTSAPELKESGVTSLAMVREWMKQNPDIALQLTNRLHDEASREFDIDQLYMAKHKTAKGCGPEEMVFDGKIGENRRFASYVDSIKLSADQRARLERAFRRYLDRNISRVNEKLFASMRQLKLDGPVSLNDALRVIGQAEVDTMIELNEDITPILLEKYKDILLGFDFEIGIVHIRGTNRWIITKGKEGTGLLDPSAIYDVDIHTHSPKKYGPRSGPSLGDAYMFFRYDLLGGRDLFILDQDGMTSFNVQGCKRDDMEFLPFGKTDMLMEEALAKFKQDHPEGRPPESLDVTNPEHWPYIDGILTKLGVISRFTAWSEISASYLKGGDLDIVSCVESSDEEARRKALEFLTQELCNPEYNNNPENQVTDILALYARINDSIIQYLASTYLITQEMSPINAVALRAFLYSRYTESSFREEINEKLGNASTPTISATPSGITPLDTGAIGAGLGKGLIQNISDFTPSSSHQALTLTLQTDLPTTEWPNPANKWTIVTHQNAAIEQYGAGTKVIGYTGNGNALCNKGHIVFLNGQLHYREDEPIRTTTYSILAVFTNGPPRVLDVRINENDRIITVDGKDITGDLDWAISGERIVKNGQAVNWRTDEAFKGYTDPRHLFWFPYSLSDKRSQEVQERTGRKDVFRQILWSDEGKKEAARKGDFIALPLSDFRDYGYNDVIYIREELLKAGYQLTDFHFTNDALVIRLRPGVYQHHTVGVTGNGVVKTVAITSKDREVGVTLDQLADRNIEAGLRDSIMLDQGGDVLVWRDGRMQAESLNNRDKFSSMIFLVEKPEGVREEAVKAEKTPEIQQPPVVEETFKARTTATVAALKSEEDAKSRDSVAVIGLPWWIAEELKQKNLNPDSYLATLEKEISRMLGKKEYGDPVNVHKFKLFFMEKDAISTKTNLQKALDTVRPGQEVVIFAPQINGELLQIDKAALERFGNQCTVIPDAYSDIDTSKTKGFPDVDARIAITRLIAWCKEAEARKNADAQKAALEALTTYISALTDKQIPPVTDLNDLLRRIDLLRIKPVNYKDITDWRNSYEAVATAL